MKKKYKIITIIISLILTIFLGVSFFVWALVPSLQMRTFFINLKKALNEKEKYEILNSKFSFYPMNYSQPELRKKFVDYLLEELMVYGSVDKELVLFGVEKLEEGIKYEDNYSSFYLTLGKAYDYLADTYTEKRKEYLLKAEGQYKKGLEMLPGSQRIMIAYSINLLNQGKIDDALSMVNFALAEDPRVFEMHYYRGVMLYQKGGDKNFREAIKEIEFAFDNNHTPANLLSKKIYEKLLVYFYNKGDENNVKIIAKRLSQLDRVQTDTYKRIVDFIEKNNTMPLLQLHK